MFNFNDRLIMNYITNTIEIEYEGWTVEVEYTWKKGYAGNWLQPPEEHTIDITNIEVISLIDEDCQEVAFDKNHIPDIPYNIIEEEIIYDVENLM